LPSSVSSTPLETSILASLPDLTREGLALDEVIEV
jgi:hypothetical protein